MIYRCSRPTCNFIAEQPQELVPGRCPVCQGRLESVQEQQLTAGEWTLLGIYHLEQSRRSQRAYQCFRKAAALGDAWGASNLGWCLESGTGCTADPAQALWLYEQAAEMGYQPALCNAGFCYQQGIGTRKDPEKAVEYFRKAAAQQNSRAQHLLAQ